MRILIYGGSFNPPHTGHVSALRSAIDLLKPDKTLVIPTSVPPHKTLSAGAPDAETRLELARAAFEDLSGAEVSDMEILRGGKSYTVETLSQLREQYPEASFSLLLGTDMFLSIEEWYEFRTILREAELAVAVRDAQDVSRVRTAAESFSARYGARCIMIPHEPITISSTELRALLPLRQGTEYLPEEVYALIIRKRLYGAQPAFTWLRRRSEPYLKKKRVPHVRGCAQEARKLALRWGEDPDLAEEAGILHDITKKLVLDEQLHLCEKYGIINDTVESASEKLLHAKTGAALSRELFGVGDVVYNGIRWHTTGRAGMSRFEQIIYLADYMEPTRDFDGVDALRALAYQALDEAMILGLKMSLEDLARYGVEPHRHSREALAWFLKERNEKE